MKNIKYAEYDELCCFTFHYQKEARFRARW